MLNNTMLNTPQHEHKHNTTRTTKQPIFVFFSAQLFIKKHTIRHTILKNNNTEPNQCENNHNTKTTQYEQKAQYFNKTQY